MAEKPVSIRGLWRFLNNLKDLFVQDAPSDGKQYARKNKTWAEVQGGGPVDAYTKEEADALLALKAPKGIPFIDLGYQPSWEHACEAMCNSPVRDAMYFKSHDDDFDYYYVCVYKYDQGGIVRGFYTNTEEFTIGTFEWEMGEGDVKVDYFNPTRVIDNLITPDEYAALSANQGKVLNTKLGQLEARKQDTISDLATIRSGAVKGATALQSVPSTYRTAAQQDAMHDDTKADVSALSALDTRVQALESDYATALTLL